MDLTFEQHYWGNCLNTFDEEQKHYIYAKCLQIPHYFDSPYSFSINVSVLDIGGGPTSMLLKCIDHKKMKVVDPLEFPEWVLQRYKTAGIDFQQALGEDINESGWDEVWIYNCLQHVDNPAKLIDNAHRAGKVIRLFEWLAPAYDGHSNILTEENLNKWLQAKGKTIWLSEQGCSGCAYYGVFKSIYNSSWPTYMFPMSS